MKKPLIALLLLFVTCELYAETDTTKPDTKLNMDAVYDRPFMSNLSNQVSIGGYLTANYFRDVENGISEGHHFGMPRMTIFLNANISRNIKFLTELEFEEGGNEILIEFAALDIIFDPLFNIRAGIIMNPIGSFNQNHDDPLWEFGRRPVYATQLLPATWSNVGFGIYGKQITENWTFGYEAYLTNGFNSAIIDNGESKTFLPAAKENHERFSESLSGVPMITGKISVKHSDIGELGLSTMRGTYNQIEIEGITIDKERGANIYAIDYNNELPNINTEIIAEASWINVDTPENYTEQFGSKQFGGFVDIVQPIVDFNFMNFENVGTNLALRLDYVDWNDSKFDSTGESIGDEYFAITPGFSLRPNNETVIRFNYSYAWVTDFFGNPPSEVSSIIIGISSYF